MEADGLMFDFDFDDEVDLIANPRSQTHPTQQNTTLMNFSHEHVDQTSISRQNFTASAHTNSQDLDSSLENNPNLAAQVPSSVNPNPFMGTTQAYNPTTEINPEFQLPAEENNNRPQINMVNNSSANLSGRGHFSQECTNLQLLASGSNNFSQTVTLSFNTPLSGAAAQPYFPTMHVELGSSSGSNFFLYNSNSSQQHAQNLMGSTYNLGFGGTNPSLRNAANVQQNQSNFLQSTLSAASKQYPPTTSNQVEMTPQFGRVSSFNPAQEINSNNSNQLSTCSENGLQNELIPPQGMDSLNLPTTLSADQLAQTQSVRNNHDFLNNQRLALAFPQTSTGLGSVNQQPPTWLSNQNSSCIPLTPSRPQLNQFLTPNAFNPQSASSMPPGSSVPLRPQHSATNQQQQFNAVPVAENALNPQSQYYMMPEQSMFPRPQNLPSQSNQVLPLAPNVQEPQGCSSSMRPTVPFMPLNLRPPQFPLHQRLNQAAGSPALSNFHSANSMQLKNSLLPRTQQSSSDDHGSLTLNHMVPNMIDPQRDNCSFPNSSLPPRTQTFDLQALFPTTKPSVTHPIPDIFGGLNHQGTTTCSTFPPLELSLNRSEQTFLGRRNRVTSTFESGEASSSKRPRMSTFGYKDFILKENGSSPSQSQENQGDNPLLSNPFNNNQGDNPLLSSLFNNNNIARPGKNALYDPIFEGIGLPIDPHLRLFNAS